MAKRKPKGPRCSGCGAMGNDDCKDDCPVIAKAELDVRMSAPRPGQHGKGAKHYNEIGCGQCDAAPGVPCFIECDTRRTGIAVPPVVEENEELAPPPEAPADPESLPPPPLPEGEEIRDLEVRLTPVEVAERAGELAHAVEHRAELDAERRTVMAEWRETMGKAGNAVENLAHVVATKTETREVRCRRSFVGAEVLTHRLDTGEEIERRAASDEERQRALFDEPPPKMARKKRARNPLPESLSHFCVFDGCVQTRAEGGELCPSHVRMKANPDLRCVVDGCSQEAIRPAYSCPSHEKASRYAEERDRAAIARGEGPEVLDEDNDDPRRCAHPTCDRTVDAPDNYCEDHDILHEPAPKADPLPTCSQPHCSNPVMFPDSLCHAHYSMTAAIDSSRDDDELDGVRCARPGCVLFAAEPSALCFVHDAEDASETPSARDARIEREKKAAREAKIAAGKERKAAARAVANAAKRAKEEAPEVVKESTAARLARLELERRERERIESLGQKAAFDRAVGRVTPELSWYEREGLGKPPPDGQIP